MKKRDFSEAILFYRGQRRLTQTAMAELLGLSFRYYQKLESGKSEPSLTTVEKVLDGLNVPFAEFFQLKPIIQPQTESPDWMESARVLQAYLSAQPERRLLALYILTDDEQYLTQYEALPDAPRIASVLKKVL